MESKACTRCKVVKPFSEFSPSGRNPGGLSSWCKECRAEDQRDRKARTPAEERNAQMRAYKAGMRKDKCGTCGAVISGLGVCGDCREAMDQLGGTVDSLKMAVKALRWLEEG